MNVMLETPSRVWRRIEDVEGGDLPSLPSLPGFDETHEHHTTESDSLDMDLSGESEPMHSTPAHTSYTASTIRPSVSTSSALRFANSIASRSSKSGLSGSRGSRRTTMQPKDYSFDISAIPSLPHPVEDTDIRSSDQDTSSRDLSVGEPRLPRMYPNAAGEDDLDLSDALRSISREEALPLDIEPTPRKKYDYSVSLRSEPKPSPYDKLRNVAVRRPLSRNTRTPSLTRTATPSEGSSSAQSTPQSTYSPRLNRSHDTSPTPAHAIPLPRSVTASPMPLPRAASASPMPARFIPLPASASNSPVLNYSPQSVQRTYEQSAEEEFADPSSLQPPDLSFSSDEQNEPDGVEESVMEREPTFSSEEGVTQQRTTTDQDISDFSHRQDSIAPPPSSTFSSPSAMLTPTPAFQPRRARFNVQPLPQPTTTPSISPEEPDESQEEEQPTWRADQQTQEATPNAHKRSFLLSVINSTARPRLKYPSKNADGPATPGVNLQNAFAGVTPGVKLNLQRRMSHPLAQGWTAAKSDSGSGNESPGGYDGAVDRVSFLSTTSSQDLAIHARANASFDPAVGLGDRGRGVDRFNAAKLNNYLHGLNQKLQEENETLVAQLRQYEARLGGLDTSSATSGYDEPVQNRRASAGRRVSAGPLGLNDVMEEKAEDWIEEKAEMEDMLDDLREQLEKVEVEKESAVRERDDVEKALEEEKAERARDKEKWRERMGEVEKGVQDIVDDIYQKLRAAEDRAQSAEKEKTQAVKDIERRLAEVVVERDVLAERLEKTEGALEHSQDLGSAVNAANERVSKVLADLKNANLQIKGLEEEAVAADEHIDSLEHALGEEKKIVAELEEELHLKSEELQNTLHRTAALDEELTSAQRELEEEKAIATEMEQGHEAAAERIESLEELIGSTQERLAALTEVLDQERERATHCEAEAERASELAREMEEALDAAEAKMRSDEEQISVLRTKVMALERELDRSRSRIDPSGLGADADAEADIAAMEAELDEAHKEIARLTMMVSQSPARKAVERAKDAKIEMLEQERDDLVERLKSLKNNSFGTPGKMLNGAGISPMHRHLLNLSFKSPKTPGGPLRDLSWLQTTMNDATASPLIAEIERLQQELEQANESIDDKLDRLEDAGLGVVSLTNQLEDARSKIISLEENVARLQRREERRIQRLEKLRCQKCRVKVDVRALQVRASGDESSFIDPADLSMEDEPETPPTKTTERLRADLQAVNTQLASMKQQWDSERRRLLGENATLKDAASRLNAEVRQVKDEVKRYSETERGKAGMQAELDKAKRMVGDLEAQLKSERSRLRGFTTEQNQAERQKEEVVLQLRRTESDMADIREELQRIKHENHELEAELRTNSNVEQKARLLESKVVENTETIENLRRERTMLVSDHKELQKKHAHVSKHLSQLREEHAASQTSHDQRRHELDLRLLEIEDLRKTLSEQTDELHRVAEEKNRASSENSDMARNVASLEADLRRVKRDAEVFGRDLKQLRTQKERLEAERKEEATKTERAQKQAQTQIRLLRDEAKEERERNRTLQDQWNSHTCSSASTDLSTFEARHKAECKGLVLQINYLKAKWVRESNMRDNLGNQKQYLLVLLAKSERLEDKILAAIARAGFPNAASRLPAVVRKKRTLKNVTLSVIFVLRAKRAMDAWRTERAKKAAIPDALADVRRHREETARAKIKGKQRALS
ncbi:hypothetical protein BDW22DRAFT_1399775 [Trametopsis cervina]|nr:hypothetical protein BDW22DRAFT_1399775 [Trametopsis cervina]